MITIASIQKFSAEEGSASVWQTHHINGMDSIWVASMRLGIKLPVTCHKVRLGMMPFGRLKASGIKYFNS